MYDTLWCVHICVCVYHMYLREEGGTCSASRLDLSSFDTTGLGKVPRNDRGSLDGLA